VNILELLKAAVIGIIEGLTEWLPISSTGHMILADEFVKLDVSPQFWEMFLVVIQLGAICAVIVLFFNRLNPFAPSKGTKGRRATWKLWAKVIVGCIPAAILGILLDDWFEEHFYNALTVAVALVVYGIAFIVIERVKGPDEPAPNANYGKHASGAYGSTASAKAISSVDRLGFGRALAIGVFQCLAIIPGTSRSGSTILGGRILGVSRSAAAEFSFFLAIPVMFGWSLLKLVKGFVLDNLVLTTTEWGVFAVGIIVAFAVSILSIKFLMGFIRRHSFELFGWYRIALGIIVLAFFFLAGQLFNIQ
jgi:undecaprenyl-diphosphatase